MSAPFYSDEDVDRELSEFGFDVGERKFLADAVRAFTHYQLREFFIFLRSLQISERKIVVKLAQKKSEILASGNTAAWEKLIEKEVEIIKKP